MAITAQDKKQVLLDAGIDPERYWIDDEGEVINMEKQGATESGVKSALYNAPRSALGFVGAALGTAGAGALGAPSGPGAIATGAAGGLAGAAVGATIGEKIQSALYPAGWRFAEEARSVNQPGAVYAGQLASNLVTMRPSPKMIGQLLSTAPKEFIKSAGQISPASRSALLNVAAGGALGGGVTMASGGDAGDVAREALVGALFHQPTKIGQKLSRDVFTPWTPDPTAAGSTGGMAEALQARAAAINKMRADAAAAERVARQTAFDEAVARGEAPMPVEDVPEPTPYEASGVEGELGVAPSEDWNNWLASLAPKFKAKFRITDEPIRMPDGSLAAGEMRPRRTPAEMAEIDVSSSGRADTGGHEYLHDMIEDVLNYGTPRERAFMEQAVKQLGLDVVESGGKRMLRGNLEELIGPREGGALRSEEEMVQMLGEDIVRRAVKPEQFDTTKQALKDFTDYYLRNRMTPEAARRLLTGRLMYGRGTAPSVEAAARRAGKTTGAPAPAATSMAEKVEKTEIAPELEAERARKAELDRAEAAQLKAENDAREARRADMDAAFAAKEKNDARARMVANMENLPTSPKRVKLMEDMTQFADTGGEMSAGELPLAEPDQSYDLGNVRSVEEVTPGTEVARPETLTYTGESIPANIRRGREMRENAAESPEDLELRRIEDKLSGRSRSKYQPMADEEAITIKAYRGTQVKGPQYTQTGRTFWAPSADIAKQYGPKVEEATITFSRPLKAENWLDAKKKLGLPSSAKMDDIFDAAESNGYDGIVWNHHGSTEYVKLRPSGNEIKYQPFSTDFEKELAQARPFKLQVAKDGRMSGKDVLAAVDRLNPTEQEMIKSAGLDRFLRTVVRPNAAELKAWAEENVPRVEVKELLATGSTSKEDARLNEVKHILDTEFMAEQRQWRDSGGDFDALETVKAGMPPERASRFSDLVNELTELRLARRMSNPSYEKNDSATREFDVANINPRQLADMPGAVDLLVRLPGAGKKAERWKDPAGNVIAIEAEPLYSSDHYPQSGDNLLAHLRAYEHTMPNGEKVLRVFELQSDWAQDRRKEEARYSIRKEPSGRYSVDNDTMGRIQFATEAEAKKAAEEYADGVADHPLLQHHQRLALKAAIEHARRRGIKKVVVDDAETAMMTEGHDKIIDRARKDVADANADLEEFGDDAKSSYGATGMLSKLEKRYKNKGAKFEIQNGKIVMTRGPFEGGMGQAYEGSPMVRDAEGEIIRQGFESNDDAQAYVRGFRQESAMRRGEISVSRGQLHEMMRDLSGEGVKVELGEHRNAVFTDTPEGSLERAPGGWRFSGDATGKVYPTQEAALDAITFKSPRPDLIFKNPDGTPKTQSTGYAYDVSAAQARRDAGEPFSYAGRKYQPMREEQIQSPEFKKWFGDSVVRDETGKPKMVYHGSRSPGFNEFRTNKSGYTYGQGAYFTPEPRRASEYSGARERVVDYDKNGDPIYGYPEGEAGGTYAVYLSLKKPFVTSSDAGVSDIGHKLRTTNPKLYNELRNEIAAKNNYSSPETVGTAEIGNSYLRKQGYDGVIKEWHKGDPLEYVVFEPNQIKSATGNRGTFDPSNPDIRYQPLGPDEGSYKGAKLPAREQPRRGIFAGNVEALRRSGNPDKQYFAERADELFARIRNYTGKYENEILKPLVDLSTADQKALVELLYDEDATGTPITPAARLRPAYKAIRAGLKLMATDQIAAGQLISGAPRGVNPTYFPNVVDPTVLHDLAYNTGSKRALELERQYIDYNTDHYMNKRGMSRADAAALARESFDAFRGALKPMSIEGGFDFGAVTMREGGKLPPTWVSADPVAGFRSYIKRFARSRAFYDTIQRDERAMAALGGKNYFDAAGREQPVTIAADNLARDPNARALMESAIGVTHESQEGITPAIGRLANSLLLSNVMTRVTDVATTPFKALSYLPASEIPGLIGHLGNMRKSMENAYRTGGVRRGDMMVLRDVLGAGDRFVRGSDKLAEQIVKWTGSEALEKGARFLAQNVGEYVYDVNKTLAARGDKRALEFLNRLTPEWRTLDRAEVSQRVAQLFQGRYDATNLPIWIANSPAAPFFSMMKWNIEQWNNFKRFSWQPALNGDPMPLVKTLLGGALGGAIVGELREDISGKKQRVATMDELRFGFDKGDKSRAAVEAMRKAAFIAQVTGTLGIVGELGLQALDIGAKDKPQGFSWPAFEMAAGAVSKIQNAASAVVEKPDNAGQILANMANDLAKDNFSQYRILLNTLDRAGVDTGAAAGPGQVEESNRRRDLRMSNKLRGEKVQFSPFIEADYAGTKERRMDKTRDMAEARRLGMELKREARTGAKTQEEYESALGKLRASRIVGIPSKENNPAQYRAHIQFVLETQGEEAAARLRQTYARLRREQQIKAAPFK